MNLRMIYCFVLIFLCLNIIVGCKKEQNPETKNIQPDNISPARGDALLVAAKSGDISMVRTLISQGAYINIKDKYGCTPLHLAAMNGHTSVVEMLIAKGADINDKMMVGMTPLHGAAQMNQTEMVKLLIDKGADVNARDISGHTPLHVAAFEGHLAVAELLLDKGADVNVKGYDGVSPLLFAIEQNHKALAEMLKRHGAQQKKKPLAEYLLNASQFVNIRGDEELAERELREAIKQYPSEAEAHYVYGNFLYNFFRKRRGLDQAENELRIAIKLNPKHGRAHYDLGRVLGDKGLQSEAKHEFEIAESLGIP